MITKQRGIIAEAKIKADLLSKGYDVAVPEGDYLPFDLICITSNLNIYKIQVKSHKIKKNGAVPLSLRRNRYIPSKRCVHNRTYTKKEVDVFALYIPDIDECFYISSDILDNRKCAINFRVKEPKNGNIKNIRMVRDYKDFPLP